MANIILHYICPILSLVSFLLFEREIKISNGIWTAIVAIPSCIYWITYIISDCIGHKHCTVCNYEETITLGDPPKLFPDSDTKGTAEPYLYGWVCPKCGAVMSPYTSFCPNCTQLAVHPDTEAQEDGCGSQGHPKIHGHKRS